MTQASIWPLAKAAAASGGPRSKGVMSARLSPTDCSALRMKLCADEPRLKATFLPLRSARVLIGLSALTGIAEPSTAPLVAAS